MRQRVPTVYGKTQRRPCATGMEVRMAWPEWPVPLETDLGPVVVAEIPRRMRLQYASLGSSLLTRKTRWRAWELRLWGPLEMGTDRQCLEQGHFANYRDS